MTRTFQNCVPLRGFKPGGLTSPITPLAKHEARPKTNQVLIETRFHIQVPEKHVVYHCYFLQGTNWHRMWVGRSSQWQCGRAALPLRQSLQEVWGRLWQQHSAVGPRAFWGQHYHSWVSCTSAWSSDDFVDTYRYLNTAILNRCIQQDGIVINLAHVWHMISLFDTMSCSNPSKVKNPTTRKHTTCSRRMAYSGIFYSNYFCNIQICGQFCGSVSVTLPHEFSQDHDGPVSFGRRFPQGEKEGPTKAHLSTVWTVWCGTLGHRYGMFNTAHHSPGNAEGCVARLNMFSKAMSSNNDPLGKLQQQDVPFCRQQCVQIWAGKTPLMTILTYMLSADLEYSFRQNYKISKIWKLS